MVKYFACLFVKKRFQCEVRGVDLVTYFARLYITKIGYIFFGVCVGVRN